MSGCCYKYKHPEAEEECGCQFDVPDSDLWEHDGKKYCIFHIPAEAKKMWDDNKGQIFLNQLMAFTKNLSDNATEHKKCEIDFTGVVFPKNYKNVLKNDTFNNLSYISKIIYDGTIFLDNSELFLALSSVEYSLNKSRFLGVVVALIDGGAKYKNISFVEVTFSGALSSNQQNIALTNFKFLNCTFENGFFNNCRLMDCDFFGSKFYSKDQAAILSFRNISNTEFENVEFYLDVLFNNEIKNSSFKYAKFFKGIFAHQSLGISDVDFNNCTFGKEKEEAKRPRISFENTNIYDGVTFENAVFYTCPRFYGAEIHENVKFNGAKFYDFESEYAESAYRFLKTQMIEHNHKIMEIEFYGCELECKLKKETSPVRTNLMLWAYKCASNFGRSIIQPAMLLFGVFIFFWSCYWIFILVNRDESNHQQSYILSVKSMNFTIDRTIRPFEIFSYNVKKEVNEELTGKKENPSFMLKVFAILQTALNLSLFTVFILAIRRKYKMD